MKIIDSNIWISFFNLDDINNNKADEILSELISSNIYLTDYIILEVSTILLQKAGKVIANNFIDFVQNSSNIHIICSSHNSFNDYLSFFKENSFNKLSFIDQSLLFLSKTFDIVTFDKELIKQMNEK